MKIVKKVILVVACLAVTACSTVNITKTAKGIYPSTAAADVQILGIVPVNQDFEELGILSANVVGTDPSKVYNTIREKAAAIGADAVIINNQMPYGSRTIINGSAIKYK
jgi:hypothetical protein